ncbi:peptidoglycan-binding protein [Tateyamaria omphalii]|uniref:peptidoglycan-binding protein n=1 Tax=Tateyamaria omphalii TaxID=299262 RepID=UPI001C9982D5|nr:peptidoglycan-binding protein [Tateyamaria omphalii]MBY5933112.1 peptidoglycan-binding protein [Tateyamaria omphalii]
MATMQELERQLESMRKTLQAEWNEADDARREEIEIIGQPVLDALDRIAFFSLHELAAEVARLRSVIDGFLGPNLPDLEDEMQALRAETAEILDLSAEEVNLTAPVPEETPVVPYEIVAEDPGEIPTGAANLTMTEAHLIALWKRSQFPLPTSGMITFGLRGCRPVDYAGTPFAASHALEMRNVNYQTMNCTLGQWRPGNGFALFPGSTVPFNTVVEGGIAKGGKGVNQMGRGRYKRYAPGWHKFSEQHQGHWALRQESFITLQRTSDDADYDGDDPWFATLAAGDNIHCAFSMGIDSNIPDAKFSSAGCQTVAGKVKKGVKGSEKGPWKKFIAPFQQGFAQEFDQTEYVLFDAAEMQQMVVGRGTGKSIILRFGSEGPLVRQLQAALKAVGHAIKVDGDFGPGTFSALRDFQIAKGEEVDGILGPATASDLGFTLPTFDFDNAISGGPGYVQGGGDTRRAIAWGATTLSKDSHGETFNQAVCDMCERLNVDPDHMMAVMAFETGSTFSPSKLNKAGSSAIGLIQFLSSTADDLGTSTDDLADMSPLEQLVWVEKYFRRAAGGRVLASLSDVYMAVLYPKAIGKPESFVLFEQGSDAYTLNVGLDTDKSGTVTKVEAATKVQNKLRTGLKPNNIG